MKYLSLVFLCMLALSGCAGDGSKAAARFQDGLDQRESKPQAAIAAFAESGRDFAQLLKSGRGDAGKLAYNASQAFQFAGEFSRARAFGLLAVLERPLDPKVAAWYQKLRQDAGTDTKTEVIEGWQLVVWGRELWTLGGALWLTLLLGGAIAAWHWRQQRTWLRPVFWLALAAFSLFFGFSWLGKLTDRMQAVAILRSESALHQGDSQGFPAIDPVLKVGTPLRVLETRAGWVRIHAATGTEGWLPAEEIQELAELIP